MLKVMSVRIGVSLLLGGLIAGCNDGVELSDPPGLIEPFLNPFAPSEPLVINDTEARRFIDADGSETVVAASPTCVANEQPITPEFMTFTDGFFLDSVGDGIEGVDPVAVVRAGMNVDNQSSQFIEVCIESDGDREYFIETRVQGPSAVEDSYFFTVGDSEPVIYDVGRSNQNSLGIARDFVRSRDTDPLRVMLSDGRNTLRFFYRERNTALELVKAFRMPTAAPVVNADDIDSVDGEFSEAELQCAANTGLTPNEVTALVEQHLPSGPVEYRLEARFFVQAQLAFFWRMFEGMRQTTPTVFCLTDSRPGSNNSGLSETTNLIVGPFELPTLILGGDGDDRIARPHALNDQVVFYGFGGDDFVEWQTGGQFFGGEGLDTVSGLTEGFFDGGAGNNDVVEAATAAANIMNAEVTVSDVEAPAPPENIEVIGEDDVFTYLTWEDSADEQVTSYVLTNLAEESSLDISQIRRVNLFTLAKPTIPRRESLQTYGIKSILTVIPSSSNTREVTLLSASESSITFQLPTFDELLERFDAVTLRGPEQVDNFEDATTADGSLRWLSVDALSANRLSPTDPVIQRQFPDLSLIQSLDRQTLQTQASGPIEGLCNIQVGEDIHIVLAQTPAGGDVFAFDADNLSLRWSRTIGFDTVTPSDFCNRFHLDQNDVLYVLNQNSEGALVETIRISPDNIESRLAPAASQEIFVEDYRTDAGAYDSTTAVVNAFVLNEPDAVASTTPGIVVQRFDGSQTFSEFLVLDYSSDALAVILSNFNGSPPIVRTYDDRAVTDGVNMWSVGFGRSGTQGIKRINLTTGVIDAVNVLERTDQIFDETTDPIFDGRIFPIHLIDGVIEVGREGRVIRFDANTLERLVDVKVVGDVVAFDAESVTTRLIDEDGSIRAFRFDR